MERQMVNLLKDRDKKQYIFKEGFYVGFPSKYDKYLNGNLDLEEGEKVTLKHVGQMDTFIDLRSDGIYVLDIDLNIIQVINYHQIRYVNLSMCSRNSGIRYNRYQIDVDIYTENEQFAFEIFNPDSFQLMIDAFNNQQIECVDIVGIIELYNQFPEKDKRIGYLDMNFNKIAKKYQLDHPRQSKVDYKERLEKTVEMYQTSMLKKK